MIYLNKKLIKALEEVLPFHYDLNTTLYVDDVVDVIEDLLSKIYVLQEEVEFLKEDMEENYTRKRDDYDFYGVSKNDF